jgi:hypothetical protein
METAGVELMMSSSQISKVGVVVEISSPPTEEQRIEESEASIHCLAGCWPTCYKPSREMVEV